MFQIIGEQGRPSLMLLFCTMTKNFDNSIFLNVPFDIEYRKLLRPMLFTCIYCGLEPHLSDLTDSGQIRVQGIIDLLKGCKYSIHDLSRIKSKKEGELARFNMPFELGLDYVEIQQRLFIKNYSKKEIVGMSTAEFIFYTKKWIKREPL